MTSLRDPQRKHRLVRWYGERRLLGVMGCSVMKDVVLDRVYSRRSGGEGRWGRLVCGGIGCRVALASVVGGLGQSRVDAQQRPTVCIDGRVEAIMGEEDLRLRWSWVGACCIDPRRSYGPVHGF